MKTYYIANLKQFKTLYPMIKSLSAINSVPQIHLIGFDCEKISKNSHEKSFEEANWVKDKGKVICCTIQIAIENIAFFILLSKLGPDLPLELIEIIKSDNWLKVGVGVTLDIQELTINYQLGQCSGDFDISHFCMLADYPQPNLAHLAEEFAHMKLNKSRSHGDWSKPPSTQDLEYACKDAVASYLVFKNIVEPSLQKLRQSVKSSDTQKYTNYISLVNEHMNSEKILPPNFRFNTISDSEVLCTVDYSKIETRGVGSSKKEAKQKAFEKLCKKLNLI